MPSVAVFRGPLLAGVYDEAEADVVLLPDLSGSCHDFDVSSFGASLASGDLDRDERDDLVVTDRWANEGSSCATWNFLYVAWGGGL